ncbi:MAG: hypothetical protein KAR31_08310, partial [Candidatus Omnitrophica bacterium]|nr:hypothetical protein [Candidatus Omnitrophota bacterium]
MAVEVLENDVALNAGQKEVQRLRREIKEERRKERERGQWEEKAAVRLEQRKVEKEARKIERLEKSFQKRDERELETERESFRFGRIQEGETLRRSGRISVRSGIRTYKGEVYNDGKYTKENVLVVMDFYGWKGDLLFVGRASADPSSIKPGGK